MPTQTLKEKGKRDLRNYIECEDDDKKDSEELQQWYLVEITLCNVRIPPNSSAGRSNQFDRAESWNSAANHNELDEISVVPVREK